MRRFIKLLPGIIIALLCVLVVLYFALDLSGTTFNTIMGILIVVGVVASAANVFLPDDKK